MEGFLVILLVAILFALLICGYIIRQGNAEFEFMVEQRTPFILEKLDDSRAVFSCKIPFLNKGNQDGTLTDVYPRHLLPYEYYYGVEVSSRLTIEAQPREDGYWEAMIVFKNTGGVINLTVNLTATKGDICSALTEMVDMPVDIVYQAVSRSDWYITKTTLVMGAEEIKAALKSKLAAQQGAI